MASEMLSYPYLVKVKAAPAPVVGEGVVTPMPCRAVRNTSCCVLSFKTKTASALAASNQAGAANLPQLRTSLCPLARISRAFPLTPGLAPVVSGSPYDALSLFHLAYVAVRGVHHKG